LKPAHFHSDINSSARHRLSAPVDQTTMNGEGSLQIVNSDALGSMPTNRDKPLPVIESSKSRRQAVMNIENKS
jgi:hypothetical protein